MLHLSLGPGAIDQAERVQLLVHHWPSANYMHASSLLPFLDPTHWNSLQGHQLSPPSLASSSLADLSMLLAQPSLPLPLGRPVALAACGAVMEGEGT